MKDAPKKKIGLIRVILIVLVAATAILAVIMAVNGRDGGFRGLWDAITGGSDATEFYYESSSGGAFGAIGNRGLAVASNSGLYVFDKEGKQSFSMLFSFESSSLDTAGNYGVTCDIGGKSVIFFNTSGVISQIEMDYPVISATVNEEGYLCVCTEESGYLGSVTVYNSEGTDIYKWYSGSARVLSADANDGSQLLVLTIGQGGSNLVLMPLSSEQETSRYSSSGLIIDAGFDGNNIWAVTTESVLFFNNRLEERGTYDFSGKYLEAYAAGSGYLVLRTSDYQMGGQSQIVSLSDSGQELGSAMTEAEPVDMAASDETVAILYSGSVVTYDLRMSPEGRAECASGTERVVIRSDGTILAAGAFSAYVCEFAEYAQDDASMES